VIRSDGPGAPMISPSRQGQLPSEQVPLQQGEPVPQLFPEFLQQLPLVHVQFPLGQVPCPLPVQAGTQMLPTHVCPAQQSPGSAQVWPCC